MIRQFDYLVDKLDKTQIGFSSDFDGAKNPGAIGSAAGLPALRKAMIDHGYR